MDHFDGHPSDTTQLPGGKKFISSRSFTMFKKQSETRGKQTALIEEMIGNQKVVKAFGYEDKASKRF